MQITNDVHDAEVDRKTRCYILTEEMAIEPDRKPITTNTEAAEPPIPSYIKASPRCPINVELIA